MVGSSTMHVSSLFASDRHMLTMRTLKEIGKATHVYGGHAERKVNSLATLGIGKTTLAGVSRRCRLMGGTRTEAVIDNICQEQADHRNVGPRGGGCGGGRRVPPSRHSCRTRCRRWMLRRCFGGRRARADSGRCPRARSWKCRGAHGDGGRARCRARCRRVAQGGLHGRLGRVSACINRRRRASVRVVL